MVKITLKLYKAKSENCCVQSHIIRCDNLAMYWTEYYDCQVSLGLVWPLPKQQV